MSEEPTATEALAYVGMRVAHAGAWCVIGVCLFLFWVGTP